MSRRNLDKSSYQQSSPKTALVDNNKVSQQLNIIDDQLSNIDQTKSKMNMTMESFNSNNANAASIIKSGSIKLKEVYNFLLSEKNNILFEMQKKNVIQLEEVKQNSNIGKLVAFAIVDDQQSVFNKIKYFVHNQETMGMADNEAGSIYNMEWLDIKRAANLQIQTIMSDALQTTVLIEWTEMVYKITEYANNARSKIVLALRQQQLETLLKTENYKMIEHFINNNVYYEVPLRTDSCHNFKSSAIRANIEKNNIQASDEDNVAESPTNQSKDELKKEIDPNNKMPRVDQSHLSDQGNNPYVSLYDSITGAGGLGGQFRSKPLQVSDFLKLLLFKKKSPTQNLASPRESVISQHNAQSPVVGTPRSTIKSKVSLMIKELEDVMDIKEIVRMLIKNGKRDILVEIMSEVKILIKRKISLQFFVYALQVELMEESILCWQNNNVYLLEHHKICVNSLIECFKKSPGFIEMKLFLLQKFNDFIDFSQADQLVEQIDKYVDQPKNNIIMHNLVPLKTILLLLDFLKMLSKKYVPLEVRATSLSSKIMEQGCEMMKSVKLIRNVKQVLQQHDFVGKNLLQYMGQLETHKLLDSRVLDRVIRDAWQSEIDLTGSFFDQSTCLGILKSNAKSNQTNFEHEHRFYRRGREISLQKSHQWMLQVFLKSMRLRYTFEIIIFLALTIFFSYNVISLNTQLITFNKDFSLYGDLLSKQVQIDHERQAAILQRQTEDIMSQIYIVVFANSYSLCLLVQLLLNYCHSKLAKRWFVHRWIYIVDILLLVTFLGQAYQAYYFTIYLDEASVKYGLGGDSNEVIISKIIGFKGHQPDLTTSLSVTTGLYWLRLLLMLKPTRTFGPTICMLQILAVALFKLLVLWFIQLLFFSLLGVIFFQEVHRRENLFETCLEFFRSAIGVWDLSIYQNNRVGGYIFHMIYIFVNIVFFFNTAVALMVDVVDKMKLQGYAMSQKALINLIPTYKYDNKFGSLVMATPPLNLFVLPFLPFFILSMKCKSIVKFLNKFISLICYMPLCCILLSVFLITNLICLPLAYISALTQKLILLCQKQTKDSKPRSFYIFDLTVFFFCGLIFLLIAIFKDCLYFLIQLLRSRQMKMLEKETSRLPLHVFVQCQTIIAQQTLPSIPAKNLIYQIRDKLNISEALQVLVFCSETQNIAKKKKMSEKTAFKHALELIRTYNLVKNVIIRNSDPFTKEIDILMLQRLTEELRIRISLQLNKQKKQRVKNPGEKYKVEEHESKFDPTNGGISVPENVDIIVQEFLLMNFLNLKKTLYSEDRKKDLQKIQLTQLVSTTNMIKDQVRINQISLTDKKKTNKQKSAHKHDQKQALNVQSEIETDA